MRVLMVSVKPVSAPLRSPQPTDDHVSKPIIFADYVTVAPTNRVTSQAFVPTAIDVRTTVATTSHSMTNR